MFYKNYMLNYIDIGDTVTIVVMAEDMTNFKNENKKDGFYILNHTKSFIDVPREQYENCRLYLDNNGLFLSIFPPEIIEQSILELKKQREKDKEERKKRILFLIKNILSEEYFKEYKEKGNNLKSILFILNEINNSRIKINLEPFNIEKEYKDYLIKYWGDWKVD